jgi:hypothetical protein
VSGRVRTTSVGGTSRPLRQRTSTSLGVGRGGAWDQEGQQQASGDRQRATGGAMPSGARSGASGGCTTSNPSATGAARYRGHDGRLRPGACNIGPDEPRRARLFSTTVLALLPPAPPRGRCRSRRLAVRPLAATARHGFGGRRFCVAFRGRRRSEPVARLDQRVDDRLSGRTSNGPADDRRGIVTAPSRHDRPLPSEGGAAFPGPRVQGLRRHRARAGRPANRQRRLAGVRRPAPIESIGRRTPSGRWRARSRPAAHWRPGSLPILQITTWFSLSIMHDGCLEAIACSR